MSGIYGKVTEHPEFSIEDARRFTVEILPHEFEPIDSLVNLHSVLADRVCALCGFQRKHRVHPPLSEVTNDD